MYLLIEPNGKSNLVKMLNLTEPMSISLRNSNIEIWIDNDEKVLGNNRNITAELFIEFLSEGVEICPVYGKCYFTIVKEK